MMRHELILRGVAAAILCACAGMADAQVQNTTTRFTYDSLDNLATVTDPLGHVTQYGYDPLLRRVTVTDPNAGVTRFSYDALDQLTQVTDARNVVTHGTRSA